ncbi:multidrug effflux MFS transporter [Microbacterium sp. Marseille-Q6965]|uniref:multidrug effflux MFS transporter n=1 Tax=Microbacterium sp. Marseille-Q6965 TaxID=2965072 RepID=UPI0021B77BB1|nr:multidrug effflux MFS transporter [Microbacterium sp. Marseille-Q6965]
MAEATPRLGSQPRLTPGLIAALGFVGMAGAVSTDLYLPAFPSLQSDLGVAESAVQLTLTAFLIGAAAGQFVVGTVSDALGRRRTLVTALGLFAVIGFAASAAPTIEWLIALRLLQGVTGSVGAALARAVVADVEQGDRAARGISILIAMMGLGPVFGSPLGALLTEWGGWRLALVGLATVGAGMFLVALTFIPESLPRERRHPARIGPLLRNLALLARDGSFLGYAFAYALSYGAMMVYFGSSSFVVQRVFDESSLVYSFTFVASSIAFVAGGLFNGRLVRRAGAYVMIRIGHALSLTSAVLLVVITLAGGLSLWTWIPLTCIFEAGCAMGMSNGSALTLRRATMAAGAGSAALGLFQFGVAAVVSPFGGLWGSGTALPTAVGMAAVTLLAVAAATLGRRLERRTV